MCKWGFDPAIESKDQVLDDEVNITELRGEVIRLTARNNEWGDYILSGRISKSNVVTLTYEGTGNKQPLGGVVILELMPTRDEMRGRWIEYTSARHLVWGTTTWRKLTPGTA